MRYSRGDSGTEKGSLMPGYVSVKGLMMSSEGRSSFDHEPRVLRSTVAIGEMKSSEDDRWRGVDVSGNSVASGLLLSCSQFSAMSESAV